MTNLDKHVMEKMDYETFVGIISNIPSCIFFKDRELKYQFSSHCWAQLISDDIIGKTDVDIRKDKENAQKAMEADWKILESKKGCSYTIMSDIDGDISYLELIKEPIIGNDGEAIGIVGLINDVTEKTILEKKIVGMSEMLEVQCRELETSNEELKATLAKVEKMHESQKMFTASMNHELRSPLNGIISSLQVLMEDDSLNGEQSDCVKNALISSQMMLDIVNDLLDFAKYEMKGLTVKNEPLLIENIVNNIEFVANKMAEVKGLEFEVVFDKDMPKVLISDETKIRQVMNNFVSNAIKYTEKGKVTLKVGYEDEKLVISCVDTGQGIAKESMETLFDPFVRLEEKKNANIQGTGLGLSVVKRIIDNLMGELTVESEVNVGSTFTARIPVKIESDENIEVINGPEEDEDSNENSIDFSRLKVLCVDDSKVNVTVMASLLKKIGVSADVVFSAKDGIQKADENDYNVIFMDHMMPEMDGVEAFNYIRKNSLKNSATPIVMLTGNADASYIDFYKEQGLDGYLVKPVLKDNIVEMIKTLVEKKSKGEEYD